VPLAMVSEQLFVAQESIRQEEEIWRSKQQLLQRWDLQLLEALRVRRVIGTQPKVDCRNVA